MVAFSFMGGSLGVDTEEIYSTPENAIVFGFLIGTTVIGSDGYSYVMLQNTGADIPPGTPTYPAVGVPSGFLFWRRTVDHATGEGPGPGPGPGPDPEASIATAINFDNVNYYTNEFPFADMMRKAGQWRCQIIDEPWGYYPLPPMSALGYPLELEENTYLEFFVTQQYDETLLGDTWHLQFDGNDQFNEDFWEGNMTVNWPSTMVKNGDGDYTITTNGNEAPTLRLRWTDPLDPIRNIRVTLTDVGQEFRPAFLGRQNNMRALRFMNWQYTNNSTVADFADYPTEADFPCDSDGISRVPIAVMCRAANAAGVPPWFCIPHLATDAFVEAFAQEVLANLDPSLPVYVEYSNECWNFTFDQADYCIAQGEAAELGVGATAGALWYAQRSSEVAEIFETEFGAGADRVRMVYAWQAANPALGATMMGGQGVADHCDYLAIAPYFGGRLGSPDDPTPENSFVDQVKAGGLPFIFSHIENEIDTDLREYVADYAALAATHGVELCCYEAGQHLVGVGAAIDDADLRTIFLSANRDARMGEMYQQFAQMWSEETPAGSMVCWYYSIGAPANSGTWGLMENEADTANVKWQAVQSVIEPV